MGRMWLAPLFLGFWVCGGAVADACSCGPRSAMCGPPEDYWRVGAVFVGRVTAIDRAVDGRSGPRDSRRVRLQILERFRGDIAASGEVTVLTDDTTRCGYPFRRGGDYFVYAMRQEGGTLTTTACSRTAPLEQAQMDLAYSRSAAKGSPPPGLIVGVVRTSADARGRVRPLAGIPVTISRSGVAKTASTDSWGRYAIEPPGPGTYILDVELPDTQFTPNAGQTVDFPNLHGCTAVDLTVRYDGRVTGLVTDSLGRSVAGVTVSYKRSTTDGNPDEIRRVLTRDDGSYALQRLSPGPFAINVDLPSNYLDTDPDHRSSSNIRGPSLHATLGAGQRLSLPALVLAPTSHVARLEGIVRDAAGAPATNARVFLKSGDAEPRILGEPAVTDSLGRFVMTVVEGIHYDVFAERSLGDRHGSEFSDPVTFTALPVMHPVRLTLRRRF
jgi:hypothetical protein